MHRCRIIRHVLPFSCDGQIWYRIIRHVVPFSYDGWIWYRIIRHVVPFSYDGWIWYRIIRHVLPFRYDGWVWCRIIRQGGSVSRHNLLIFHNYMHVCTINVFEYRSEYVFNINPLFGFQMSIFAVSFPF